MPTMRPTFHTSDSPGLGGSATASSTRVASPPSGSTTKVGNLRSQSSARNRSRHSRKKPQHVKPERGHRLAREEREGTLEVIYVAMPQAILPRAVNGTEGSVIVPSSASAQAEPASWPVFHPDTGSPPMSPLSPIPTDLDDISPTLKKGISTRSPSIPAPDPTPARMTWESSISATPQVRKRKRSRGSNEVKPRKNEAPRRKSSRSAKAGCWVHRHIGGAGEVVNSVSTTNISRPTTRTRTCPAAAETIHPTKAETSSLYAAAQALRCKGAPRPEVPEWFGMLEKIGTVATFDKEEAESKLLREQCLYPAESVPGEGRVVFGEVMVARTDSELRFLAHDVPQPQRVGDDNPRDVTHINGARGKKWMETKGVQDAVRNSSPTSARVTSDEENPDLDLHCDLLDPDQPQIVEELVHPTSCSPKGDYGHTLSGRNIKYEEMLYEEDKLNRRNPYRKVTRSNTQRNRRAGCQRDYSHTHTPPAFSENSVFGSKRENGRKVTWVDELTQDDDRRRIGLVSIMLDDEVEIEETGEKTEKMSKDKHKQTGGLWEEAKGVVPCERKIRKGAVGVQGDRDTYLALNDNGNYSPGRRGIIESEEEGHRRARLFRAEVKERAIGIEEAVEKRKVPGMGMLWQGDPELTRCKWALLNSHTHERILGNCEIEASAGMVRRDENGDGDVVVENQVDEDKRKDLENTDNELQNCDEELRSRERRKEKHKFNCNFIFQSLKKRTWSSNAAVGNLLQQGDERTDKRRRLDVDISIPPATVTTVPQPALQDQPHHQEPADSSSESIPDWIISRRRVPRVSDPGLGSSPLCPRHSPYLLGDNRDAQPAVPKIIAPLTQSCLNTAYKHMLWCDSEGKFSELYEEDMNLDSPSTPPPPDSQVTEIAFPTSGTTQAGMSHLS